MKKITLLILLFCLTGLHMSCVTNNDEIKSFEHVEIKYSKLNLGEENLTFSFDIEAVENDGMKPSKLILGAKNLIFKFDLESAGNVEMKHQN